MSDLFRKKSLEKLSSPDQLDMLMKVTNAKGWVALIAIGGLVLLALAWGILGSIPEKVAGQGLFIRPGGLLEITAPSAGQIDDIYIKTGDILKKGYPIARIRQKELLEEIKAQRRLLRDMEDKFKKRSSSKKLESSMEEDISFDKRKALREKVSDLKKQEEWLKEKLVNQNQLLNEGLIIKQTLIDTESALASVQQQILQAQNAQTQADLSLQKTFSQNDRELENLLDEIILRERELDRKTQELETASKVVSPYACRVVEINSYRDSQISKGAPIAKVELIDNSVRSLESVLYFPAAQSSRIKKGMKINISPSTVKQEEYGFIRGLVTHVSDFPASISSMQSVLHNNTLVQTFSAAGALVEVRADMIPDPRTKSGYKWSSGKGPDMTIETGTICYATVVAEEKRPISLVIPILKKHIMGY